MSKLINQIDHVLIQTEHVYEVFDILSEVLDIPVVWNIKSYGGIFTSGGICFGNINVEILSYAKFLRIFGIVPNKDGIIGIAFEPDNSIEDTCKMLDEIKIDHGKPKPFSGKVAGEKKTLWTNLCLKNMLSKFQIFFCKYTFDVGERRNKFNKKLTEKNGGLLGVEYIKEVKIGCSNSKNLNLWKKLLQEENEQKKSCISFESGPVINLVETKEDCILSMLVKVKSIDKAKKMLSKNKQVSLNDNNEIIIKHKKEQYLGLKLCE